MNEITIKIFNGEDHYITSNYGWRTYLYNGNYVTDFHNGTDYGTNLKKLPQYAIEDGVVTSAGVDNTGAIFAWIYYPRLNVRMLHYHLNQLIVKKNDNIKEGTLIGYTGMSGKATGIHLHLSIYDLKTNKYVDPEMFAKNYKKTNHDALKYKIGDEVIINGQLFQTSYGESAGKLVNNKKTKITRINEGGKYPYNTTGDLGWMSEDSIRLANDAIKVGDKVKVKKAIQYTGEPFNIYYDVYDVLEVKGDRIVIGIGKTVTTAINVKNIEKTN